MFDLQTAISRFEIINKLNRAPAYRAYLFSITSSGFVHHIWCHERACSIVPVSFPCLLGPGRAFLTL